MGNDGSKPEVASGPQPGSDPFHDDTPGSSPVTGNQAAHKLQRPLRPGSNGIDPTVPFAERAPEPLRPTPAGDDGDIEVDELLKAIRDIKQELEETRARRAAMRSGTATPAPSTPGSARGRPTEPSRGAYRSISMPAAPIIVTTAPSPEAPQIAGGTAHSPTPQTTFPLGASAQVIARIGQGAVESAVGPATPRLENVRPAPVNVPQNSRPRSKSLDGGDERRSSAASRSSTEVGKAISSISDAINETVNVSRIKADPYKVSVVDEPMFSSLRVRIIAARNLPAGDMTSSDPYAIIKIDGIEVARTVVVPYTLHPEWHDASFTVPALVSPLWKSKHRLEVEVWDFDEVGADDILCSMFINFESISGFLNPTLTVSEPKWYPLVPHRTVLESVGDWFKGVFSSEEQKRQALLQSRKNEESRPTDEEPLIREGAAPMIQMQVHFDPRYEHPMNRPAMGVLMIRKLQLDVWTDPGKMQLSAFVLLRFGNTLARLNTMARTTRPLWTAPVEFAVYDPASLLRIAAFQDRTIGGSLTAPSLFIGKTRLRVASLPGNTWCKFRQPIFVRRPKGVKQKGEIYIECRFEYPKFGYIGAYMRPPLPAKMYEDPDALSNRPKHEQAKLKLLTNYYEDRHVPKNEAEQLVHNEPEIPEFDISITKIHLTRVQEAIAALGLDNMTAFDELCHWKSPAVTISANVLWVYFCFKPQALVHCIVAWLICVVIINFFKRTRYPEGIDMNLMGGVVPNRHKKPASSPSPGKIGTPGAPVEQELNGEPAKEAPDASWSDKSFLHSLRKQITEIEEAGIGLQNGIASAASALERIQGLIKWDDPRLSAVLFATLWAALPLSLLIPPWLIFAIIGLVVMRHPRLRDPLPPPPVNALQRLPTRADRILYF
eukprot:TRINITY_DN12570_c0_g1_i1.p1 TRINITY_DN12570_c0_g1~~TRINITY_DN12570_c0_g1_i1.p1  ORF type:complete len:904 (+),score=88.41 TRINITY_DN12570_c0_g1_i1:48-2714(+)